MALQIKIPQQPSNTQEVTLSGEQYTIRNYFNERDNAWRIDLLDSDGNDILIGLKVMPNQNLTGRYIRDSFSEGNLWCVRTTNDKSRIDLTNFGTDLNYQLWYLTTAEEEENGLSI